jgi:hypothetical protein
MELEHIVGAFVLILLSLHPIQLAIQKKSTMAPLKPGDTVWSKSKPRRRGTITAASERGKKHEWRVHFDGEENPETLKSQQLLRKNPRHDLIEPSATNAHLPVGAGSARPRLAVAGLLALEETDVSSSHNKQEDADDLDTEDADDLDWDDADEALAKAANTLTLEDGDELLTTPPAPPPAADNSIGDEDPFVSSGEEEEDEGEAEGPVAPPLDYIPAAPGAILDSLGEPTEEDYHTHGEIDIETEDIHKAKWEQYICDKAALLSAGWNITKKASEGGGISIGATVHTKARVQRREGVVVGQVEIDETRHWLVDFSHDGAESSEPMRPQQLVLVKQNGEGYVWTLVKDSVPEDSELDECNEASPVPEEYADVGLIGFNFPEAFKPPSGAYTYPHLRLLQKLWPGDWKQQLKQLNAKIAVDNVTGRFKQKVNHVSEQQWWVFIGILISAGPHGKGGKRLWEKQSQSNGFFGMTHPINYGPGGLNIMPYYRFNDIKACFPWAFQDRTKDDKDEESYDPWHMVMLIVNEYNKNRHDWVASSVRKVLDETMSAFRPRTSKTGGFPNISYILRKPEPLGAEFKDIACSKTGTCMLPSLPSKSAMGDSLFLCA